ncbi:MAG: AI-2E family transporter [Candidatus Nanohaloarchaea archaeon]
MDTQKAVLLVLVVVLGAVSWFMVKPFLGYVLGAILLAFLLRPLHTRLKGYVGDGVSAGLMVVLAVAAFFIPVSLASAAVINDAQDLSKDVNSSNLVNTTDLEKRFEDMTGRDVEIEKEVDSAVGRFTSIAFGSFSRIFGIFANVMVGITLMLFLVYYFVKDGGKFVDWLRDLTPVSDEIQENLYSKMNLTTWAVLKGHVLVALAQGTLAGLGLVLTGVPNAVFWTFVMVLLGFVPIVGTAAVWLPASAYHFITGETLAGVFLLLHGSILVGIVDNILRPLMVDRSADIHPAVIIIGVLGGVYLFGASGLFIGPVVLGVFKAVLVTFANNYREL